MSATDALQKSIKAKIDASSVGVTVFDGPPSNAGYPRIVFGQNQLLPENADCITSQREIVQLDVFGRDQGELRPTRAIVQALYDLLHEQSLTLDDPYAAETVDVLQARTFLEPDDKTAHGLLQLQVKVQTVS